MPDTLTKTQLAISDVCYEIKELLLEKNRAYGNSALEPKRIFSQADPIEQIRVRIDDKLSRIANVSATGEGHKHTQEDTKLDLIGYLILEQVAMRMKAMADREEDLHGMD